MKDGQIIKINKKVQSFNSLRGKQRPQRSPALDGERCGRVEAVTLVVQGVMSQVK